MSDEGRSSLISNWVGLHHESPGVSNNLALLLTSFPSPGTNEINQEYLFYGDKISQKREKEGKSQITQLLESHWPK